MPEGSVDPATLPQGHKMSPWDLCPEWAPDVFAVAATLADVSGCYTAARCVGNTEVEHSAYLREVIDAAVEWNDSELLPAVVQSWWDVLVAHGQ